MKRISMIAAVILFSALVSTSAAGAQAKGNIELKSIAEIEVEEFNEEGKKEIMRIPAAKVIPGDEVIFSNHYTNVSRDTLDKVVITNPIPEHMLYKENSATGDDTEITYSIDGGKTYDRPENLKKVGIDGKEYQATSTDYTHIQWRVVKPVPLEGKGNVEFRAQLK